jgi:hypothetical protein
MPAAYAWDQIVCALTLALTALLGSPFQNAGTIATLRLALVVSSPQFWYLVASTFFLHSRPQIFHALYM